MAALVYLWRNRAKFKENDISFYKAWVKRLLTLPVILQRELRRVKLVQGGAKIHKTAEIGEGRFLGRKENLTIGSNSFLGRVELALHDEIIIGSNVCINDGVKLLTASHDVTDPFWRLIKKPIIIQDYAWIAVNAIILPGVKIGRGAIVGTGAVVSKNVEDFSIVAGNPAKPILKTRESNLNYNPCEFLAGNRAWLIG